MSEAIPITEGEEKRYAHKLPEPVGWKLLIALPEVDEKTEAGIYKPEESILIEKVSTVVGVVVKMGPLAYKHDKFEATGPWCKEGDFIVMRAFSGTRINIHGHEFRLINDDTVEAVVEDPRGIERA
jgi:co-chaperonin GroES (HSP10)